MANGQVLYEAPKSNLGGLAQLYMAGQAEVNKAREQVRTSRAAEIESLGKAISDLQLTGLHDYDKMLNTSGNLFRIRIAQAHADNSAGRITRTQATRITNQAISEANMIVNSAEIVGKNYETLKEEVEKGDKSGAELAQFESSYFGFHRNMDPKLNRTTILTDGPTGLTFQHTYQYYDADGVVKTGVKNSPLQNSINPAQAKIAGFDVIDWTKDIQSGIGDLAPPVLSGTTTINNRQVQQWARDHSNDPRIKATIEKMINGYTDNDLIGVLYDGKSVRPRWDASYTGEKDQATIDGMVKGEYIDKDGEIIDFTKPHLFTLDSDIEGNYQINDDQRALARSYLRMSAYTALSIDLKNLSGTTRSSKTGFVNDLAFEGFNFGRNKNQQHLFNVWGAKSRREQLFKEETGLTIVPTINAGLLTTYNNVITHQSGDLLATAGASTSQVNSGWTGFISYLQGDKNSTLENNPNFNLKDPLTYKAESFTNAANNFSDIFIGSTAAHPTDFNLKSMGGQKFDSIDELGYVQVTDTNDPNQQNYVIVINGVVTNAITKSKIGDVKEIQHSSVTKTDNSTVGYADRTQSKKIFNELYNTYKDFQLQADLMSLSDPTKYKATFVNDKYAMAFAKIMEALNAK